jgi:hypothetical protein
MLNYYLRLLGEIPLYFRGTGEAYLFWGAGVFWIFGTIWPRVHVLEYGIAFPRWVAVFALAGVAVYGLLRVNYSHVKRDHARIAELEASREPR